MGRILFGTTASTTYESSSSSSSSTMITTTTPPIHPTSPNSADYLESKTDQTQSSTTDEQVSFSHIHIYVDVLEDISVYKRLEQHITAFAKRSDLYHTAETSDTTSDSIKRAMIEWMDIQTRIRDN